MNTGYCTTCDAYGMTEPATTTEHPVVNDGRGGLVRNANAAPIDLCDDCARTARESPLMPYLVSTHLDSGWRIAPDDGVRCGSLQAAKRMARAAAETDARHGDATGPHHAVYRIESDESASLLVYYRAENGRVVVGRP